jgi:hypothetical protein
MRTPDAKESPLQGWANAATVILCFVTIIYCIITGIYCRATIEQLHLSRATLVADQRPWLSVKGGPSDPGNLVPRTRTQLSILIRNSGHTPAINAKRQTVTEIIPGPLKRPPKISLEGSSTQALIPAEQEVDTPATLVAYSPDDVRAVESGASTLYLYGRVEFADTFGGRHALEFCYYYHPKASTHWRLCPEGNSAD